MPKPEPAVDGAIVGRVVPRDGLGLGGWLGFDVVVLGLVVWLGVASVVAGAAELVAPSLSAVAALEGEDCATSSDGAEQPDTAAATAAANTSAKITGVRFMLAFYWFRIRIKAVVDPDHFYRRIHVPFVHKRRFLHDLHGRTGFAEVCGWI